MKILGASISCDIRVLEHIIAVERLGGFNVVLVAKYTYYRIVKKPGAHVDDWVLMYPDRAMITVLRSVYV